MQTVFVTGATGFIAKHIVLGLLDGGHRVVGSARSADRAEEVAAAVRRHLKDAADLGDRLRIVPLDLARDEGWDAALEGCDALMHTASPFPLEQPEDDAEIVATARDGALRAIRAAVRAGTGRVVLTSSSVAIMNREPPAGRPFDERDWTDLEHPTANPYARSKTLAERAAWEFAEATPDLALTTINPGFVLGPPLDRRYGTSVKVVERLLRGTDPALPRFGFQTVDVRDVAALHIRAMERPESAGRRYAAVSEFLWFREMADTLRAAFPDRRIARREAPSWLIRLLALRDRSLRTVLPILNRRDEISTARARSELGMAFRPAREAVRATGEALVGNGWV
jgi:dihydroflavonol-4-reductase